MPNHASPLPPGAVLPLAKPCSLWEASRIRGRDPIRNMLEFHSVFKRYPGGFDALKGITFSLGAGEMAFLTGHSGAGKSTLLKLVSLIERPSRGQVLLDGINLGKVRHRRIPHIRRRVGIIFQEHRLLHDRMVYDNVAMPLIIAGHGRREIDRRVRAALDKVGLLEKLNQFPVTLSGGEQQRVGIARAIVHKPPLLLADEPTGNLDPELSREIMELFRQFNQVGVSVLIATHDLALIHTMGQRILRLDHGQLVEDTDGATPATPLQ